MGLGKGRGGRNCSISAQATPLCVATLRLPENKPWFEIWGLARLSVTGSSGRTIIALLAWAYRGPFARWTFSRIEGISILVPRNQESRTSLFKLPERFEKQSALAPLIFRATSHPNRPLPWIVDPKYIIESCGGMSCPSGVRKGCRVHTET